MKKILFELAEKGLLENLDVDNLDEVLRVIVKRKFKKISLSFNLRFLCSFTYDEWVNASSK